MRGHMCTNITLVAIYKLHGDQLHFSRSAAHFVKNFAMRKPTREEAQALSKVDGASLAALPLQHFQISQWTDIALRIQFVNQRKLHDRDCRMRVHIFNLKRIQTLHCRWHEGYREINCTARTHQHCLVTDCSSMRKSPGERRHKRSLPPFVTFAWLKEEIHEFRWIDYEND